MKLFVHTNVGVGSAFSRRASIVLLTLCAVCLSSFTGFTASPVAEETIDGISVVAKSIERSRRVSLQDCPPGENRVRGVIRPNETTEFVSVHLDFSVSDAFEGASWDKPVLQDSKGETYKTAQAFTDLGSERSYSCTFSFRVPQGTEAAQFQIGETSIDLSALSE